METTRELINEFLAQHRIAMVGVSRNAKDFSRMLFRDLVQRGYDMVPVTPNAAEVDGKTCFARVQDVRPPVDAALLMTKPALTERVVGDCAEARITRVWMYRAAGSGAVSEAALAFCEQRGIHAVPGYCPYMFLPDAAFYHKLHGFFLKITGAFPK